jgi:polysaccharide export outer membrane protein
VGPRDILSFTHFTEEKTAGEDPSLDVPVSAAGDVILPLIGRVQAAGKSTIALSKEVIKRYRHFLKDPQVSIVVKEYRSKVVWVVGQVTNNGPIYLENDATSLFEVLSRAGGLVRASQEDGLDGADGSSIMIQRGPEKFVVDFFGEALEKQSSREFLVQPDDRIFVPEPADKVQILGGVRNAKEIRLRPGMTLLQAIAKAGSFTKGSRRDQIRIIHRGGGKDNTVFVDGTRIVHGKMKDIPLQPGDVVYVSEW